MDRITSIQQLRKEFKNTKSGWSKDTIFVAKAVMFLCDFFTEQAQRPQRLRRKQSQWNKFFAAGIRSGKTAKQIAEDWKSRKH